MMIETKFGIGDRVFTIADTKVKEVFSCKACEGSGRVALPDGKKYMCPSCRGCGVFHKWTPSKWRISGRLTVGMVAARVNFKPEDNEELYMMHETGIGCGTMHCAESLFATCKEAQAECDKRNTETGE